MFDELFNINDESVETNETTESNIFDNNLFADADELFASTEITDISNDEDLFSGIVSSSDDLFNEPIKEEVIKEEVIKEEHIEKIIKEPTKTSSKKEKNVIVINKVEDVNISKVEDVKVEDVKVEDVKVEDVKVEEKITNESIEKIISEIHSIEITRAMKYKEANQEYTNRIADIDREISKILDKKYNDITNMYNELKNKNNSIIKENENMSNKINALKSIFN